MAGRSGFGNLRKCPSAWDLASDSTGSAVGALQPNWSVDAEGGRLPADCRTMACVFCRIVAGSSMASRVFEDERVIAFMDIAPATPGHLLVVPRLHTASLADLDPGDGARMFEVARLLAQALRRSSIPAQGITLFLADGEAAMQEVPHSHLHVIPRTSGDGLTITADFGSPERDVLDSQAAAIRAACEAGP